MIQFDMKRFLSVGRWDVTVNRRFYTNQATALLVLAVAPVVVRFLSAWAAGDVALFGRDAAALYPAMDMGYWIWFIMGFYRFVFWVLPVVSLSYMLHNMVRKQGRIQELTLPASNGAFPLASGILSAGSHGGVLRLNAAGRRAQHALCRCLWHLLAGALPHRCFLCAIQFHAG